MKIKFITWYINGANAPPKRKKLFHYLRKLNLDIVCLQEIHIKKYLINKRLGEEFILAGVKKINGVALYIKPQFKSKLLIADDYGKFVAMEIKLNVIKSIVVAVYRPNDD
uniref:Endonuclease/exonuclease/phosphatase domain-containing protein n=1 Tax=Micrurus paraensis TaxID=1970185 RepID=A0A2D4L7E2_9SAUR